MGAQLHFNQGAWSPSREIKNKLFQHRIGNANPLEGARELMGRIDSGIDAFRLAATTFTRLGQLYCLAQLDQQGMPLFGKPALA